MCIRDRHIAGIRKLYKEKNEAMLKKLDETMPEGVAYTRPEGGIFIWCDLKHDIDAGRFSKNIIKDKVAVVPGSTFLTDEKASCSAIRLNYSMPSFSQIDQGVEILSAAVKKAIK